MVSTDKEKTSYLAACTRRHACKEFDDSQKINEDDFQYILQIARLSPSSFGSEPWHFLIVQKPTLRQKLEPLCSGSQKQIPTASHLVIALSRTEMHMQHPSNYLDEKIFARRNLPADVERMMREKVGKYQKEEADMLGDPRYIREWAMRQSYIALGNMMNAAAFIGIDSCPIEGFNRQQLTELLEEEGHLEPKHFTPAYLLAFGYRKREPRDKIRSPMEEIVTWIN